MHQVLDVHFGAKCPSEKHLVQRDLLLGGPLLPPPLPLLLKFLPLLFLPPLLPLVLLLAGVAVAIIMAGVSVFPVGLVVDCLLI